MASEGTQSDELIGQTIAGRYRIISRLGAGGMGVAYRAWDEQAGVPVVIKIPKRIFLEDPKFAERFQREIRLLQGLKHPHVVPIVDVGEYEGLPFVVMRFLPGGSLSNRRLRDDKGKPRPNPPAMLHLWLPAIAEALDYIHAQGVVHRDVKPANIFFDAFWEAYLGDFGIAKIVEESDSFDKEHTLTATHMGIGTQEYMAPEQFTPKAVIDGRADQYALAVIVYEMLSGKRPFTGETENLVVEVKTFPVPPLPVRRSDVTPLVIHAVHKALSKHPAERFATCSDFTAAVLQDVPSMADEPGVARLLCPQCSNILKLPTAAAGQKGKCPKCQTQMKVADDLGSLWLLDEARKQRKVSVVNAGESSVESDGGIDEKVLETFKPVSNETPIGRADEKRRSRLPWIYAGVAAVVAAALLVFLLPRFDRNNGKRNQPPPQKTYESRLEETWETLKQNPLDRDAIDFLARHYCFRERNWREGLSYLAKSGMPNAAALATEELDAIDAKNVNPGQLVRLARKWWEFGGRTDLNTPESSAAVRIHAGDIYRERVGVITDSSDAAWANSWLDEDQAFRDMVRNQRPRDRVIVARPDQGDTPPKPPVFLADMPVRRTLVGWDQLRMGRLPDLTINGQVYDKVIQAHASSLVVFDVPKEFVGELQGQVAIAGLNKQIRQPSSCRFRLFGNGHLLWESGVIAQDKDTGLSITEKFSVPLQDVTTVELEVDALGSNHSDWSVWVDPVLLWKGSVLNPSDATPATDNLIEPAIKPAAVIQSAIEWLVEHQAKDGSWDFDLRRCATCNGQCSQAGSYPDRAGATALALLAILSRGYTHRDGPYQKEVKASLDCLINCAVKGQGKLHSGGTHAQWAQAWGTLALTECYSMTQDEVLEKPAQLALDYIMAAQDPVGGGWSNDLAKAAGNTLATGWQLEALKSGHMSFLQVSPLTIKKAVGFLDNVQQEGGAAYGVTAPGNSYCSSAVGLLCRMHLGWKRDNPSLKQGVARLVNQGPNGDLHFNHYATQIMHQMEGDMWRAWNTELRSRLASLQVKDGHEAGSWCEGTNGEMPFDGGRLYCTAFAAMALQVYYQHLPAYRPTAERQAKVLSKSRPVFTEEANPEK